MTDDPTGNITPVHVYFLPTRLPAPGTSPGWLYKVLAQAWHCHPVARRHHLVRASRDAAAAFFALAGEHLGRRLTYWDSQTATYHHHRLEGFFRNTWREHIVCTKDEAASICDTLLQRGSVRNVHHSVADWDCGCCVALQDDATPPTRAEIMQLIACSRTEKLLSVRLRSLGLPRIDTIWYYPAWPVGGRYSGGTVAEAIFEERFSGTPPSAVVDEHT